MKNKGFTLIELLAVIVILAIIALIAVPIIINIVNDSREQANKRSVELYGKAVENAVMKYQMKGEALPDGTYSLNTTIGKVCHSEQATKCITPEVNGTIPESYTMTIGNGEITGQTMTLKQISYTKTGNENWIKGGEVNNEQASTPRYYYWGSGSISGGLPNDKLTSAPSGKSFYLAFDSSDGTTIDAAYVCFTKGEPAVEYCIQGGDSGAAFESNQGILDGAFPSACSLYGGDYHCNADGLHASASPNGSVFVSGDFANCHVNDAGTFGCPED